VGLARAVAQVGVGRPSERKAEVYPDYQTPVGASFNPMKPQRPHHHAEPRFYPVAHLPQQNTLARDPPSPPRIHHLPPTNPIGRGLDPLDPTEFPVPQDRGEVCHQVSPLGLPGISGEKGPAKKEVLLVHDRHLHITAERAQGPHAHGGFRKVEAVDAVAVSQEDGFEVHHLQKAFSPGKPHSEVGLQLRGLLQDPIKAGEVGQGGEVGLEGGLGGQVTFGQVLTLQEEKDGQGQEFSQGGFLVLLLWGELEPLSLKGLELVNKLRATPVTHPDADSHEEGFRVKGMLSVGVHSTSSFFTSQGLGSSSTRRHKEKSCRARASLRPGSTW